MRHSHLPLHWHNKQFYGNKISPALANWLCDSSSLTERLRQCAKENFRVKVLSQSWQRPHRDELNKLSQQAINTVLVREVELLCDNIPWVFARSVFPKNTLLGKGAVFTTLGEQPLIEVLNQDNRLMRSQFELANIKSLQNAAISLWARRSVFYFYGKPLLLSEVFLPPVIALCQKK